MGCSSSMMRSRKTSEDVYSHFRSVGRWLGVYGCILLSSTQVVLSILQKGFLVPHSEGFISGNTSLYYTVFLFSQAECLSE